MSSQPRWSLGSWAYEWNANGSLKKVKRPDGSVITFKYDAFGRRISKKYLRREFLYIWDKNVPLHEVQKEELCEDNVITWIFEGFTPTAKLINGKAYSIISDHIGTPILAIDTQGNKVWERELDIYGKVRKEFTSDDVANRRCGFMPFLYAGQYYDKETDLAYNRFRYYDPNTGNYISQDPIGLLGNNPNIYAYVWDTNTWIDIFGLDCKYGKDDGKKLEEDIEKVLQENNVSYVKNKKIGILGELDFETDNHIIEATVSNGGKLKQIRKYKTEMFNPNDKEIILVGPNYKNVSAINDIINEGAKVIHSPSDLMTIIK